MESQWKTLTTTQGIFQILRLGAAMCFIGHGTFGIITKDVWCNYFAVFGIGHDLAYRLMPLLGTVDITMGLSLLVYPTRAIALWLVIWGIVTAALRPLSGEPFAELIERAGNYGTPAALLFLCGGFYGIRSEVWRRLRPPQSMDEATLRRVLWCLRVTVFLLPLGHGWLNAIGKAGLVGQYRSLGLGEPVQIAHYIGSFELLSAFAILLFPSRPFLLVIFGWKMATELIYPKYEVFEWIERGGSYTAILALWYCLTLKRARQEQGSAGDEIWRLPKEA